MMPDFVIGNDGFGKNLANALGCQYKQVVHEFYSDNESCPRIMADYNEIAGKDVAVVLRTSQKPTRESVACFLFCCEDIISQLTNKELYNAGRVRLVLPYFVLGRHDHNPKTDLKQSVRERDKGKDISYKTRLKIYRALGADRILTFDPHFYRQEGSIFEEGIETVALSGVYAIGRYMKGKVDNNTIVVGLDMQADNLSKKLAEILGVYSHSLPKIRINDNATETTEVYDAQGLHVVTIDDISSTLSTLEGAMKKLRNAASVTVTCTHPVLPETGYNRLVNLLKSGEIRDFIGTDTIDSDFSKASVIPELADALRE